MTEIGDNSNAQLRSLIERVEKLEEEKKAVGEDIKDVYAEAKGVGYDPKIMKRVIALRRQDPSKRREEQDVLETYMRAVGMEL